MDEDMHENYSFWNWSHINVIWLPVEVVNFVFVLINKCYAKISKWYKILLTVHLRGMFYRNASYSKHGLVHAFSLCQVVHLIFINWSLKTDVSVLPQTCAKSLLPMFLRQMIHEVSLFVDIYHQNITIRLSVSCL